MTTDEQKQLLTNAYAVKGEATTIIEIQQGRVRDANSVIQQILNNGASQPEEEGEDDATQQSTDEEKEE